MSDTTTKVQIAEWAWEVFSGVVVALTFVIGYFMKLAAKFKDMITRDELDKRLEAVASKESVETLRNEIRSDYNEIIRRQERGEQLNERRHEQIVMLLLERGND